MISTHHISAYTTTSSVQHVLVLLQVHLQLLVSPVLRVYRSYIPYVPYPPVVVLLEVLLVSLNLLPQLPPLPLDISYHSLYPFLRHLLPTPLSQRFLQFLVIHIQRSQRLLLIMIRLPFKIQIKVIIVTLQLVFHLLLLICQILNTHRLYILLQLHLTTRLHQILLQTQSPKSLLSPLIRLLLLPLRNWVIPWRLGSGSRFPSWSLTKYRERIILTRMSTSFSTIIFLFNKSLKFPYLRFTLNNNFLSISKQITNSRCYKLVEYIELHS